MEMKAVGIIGTGLYVPAEIRTNDWFDQFDLVAAIDVFKDSGIKERRVAGKGELASDMGTKALLAAVENARISINEVDLILHAGTNDHTLPLNAPVIQYKSGAKNAAAMDVDMACASFIAQLAVARALIATGEYTTVACVCVGYFSIFADYTEKSCMMLGDGASAMIVQSVSAGKGILSVAMETDGRFHNTLGIDLRLPYAQIQNYDPVGVTAGPSEKPYFYVNRADAEGVKHIKEVDAVKVPEIAERALAKAGYTKNDIDFLIPHNPGRFLTETWRQALGVPPEKMYITHEKYGSMAGATIGANLHEAVTLGKIKTGDIVVLCGPGVGVSYNAAVMRWGK